MRGRMLVAAAVAVAAALPLSGGAQPARAAGGAMVTVYADHFLPATVTVEHGGTVTFFDPDPWGNGEAPGHTVTERHVPKPRFDSGVVSLGKAGEVSGVSSLAPGTYDFTCRIHPFMHGTLIVR
ncbi:MAG TPA: cupredoxin domain-containing protein [Candidatus Dormibacteraeota bacterium]